MSRKNHMLDIKDARIVNKNFAGIENSIIQLEHVHFV